MVATCVGSRYRGATQGGADNLNSAFHLSYNMILNLMRVEDIKPEYLLERSFLQFQTNAAVPALESRTDRTGCRHARVALYRDIHTVVVLRCVHRVRAGASGNQSWPSSRRAAPPLSCRRRTPLRNCTPSRLSWHATRRTCAP